MTSLAKYLMPFVARLNKSEQIDAVRIGISDIRLQYMLSKQSYNEMNKLVRAEQWDTLLLDWHVKYTVMVDDETRKTFLETIIATCKTACNTYEGDPIVAESDISKYMLDLVTKEDELYTFILDRPWFHMLLVIAYLQPLAVD